jgi:hypothetical protein
VPYQYIIPKSLFKEQKYHDKGLLSALLHVRPEEMLSVEITNPIVIGETIQDKKFRFDIKAVLNRLPVIGKGNQRTDQKR